MTLFHADVELISRHYFKNFGCIITSAHRELRNFC